MSAVDASRAWWQVMLRGAVPPLCVFTYTALTRGAEMSPFLGMLGAGAVGWVLLEVADPQAPAEVGDGDVEVVELGRAQRWDHGWTGK